MGLHWKFLDILSVIIGWGYFFAWSLSFYPQVIENMWRKNVNGLSFDFLTYNILGHSCYLIYNFSFFFLTSIQDEYYKLHGTRDAGVRFNDVFFSIHAVAITAFTIYQCIIYEKGPKNFVSYPTRFLFGFAIMVIIFFFFLAFSGTASWIWMLNSMGTVKVFLSFIKYVPQAYMNWRRKCTKGWSIGNIILDFTGGALSFGQMGVESINSGDWSEFKNFAKLGLSLLSIFFDLLFMFQHYILYWGNKPPETDEKKTELPTEREKHVDGEIYADLS